MGWAMQIDAKYDNYIYLERKSQTQDHNEDHSKTK